MDVVPSLTQGLYSSRQILNQNRACNLTNPQLAITFFGEKLLKCLTPPPPASDHHTQSVGFAAGGADGQHGSITLQLLLIGALLGQALQQVAAGE